MIQYDRGLNDKVWYTWTNSPVALKNDRAFFMPQKEVSMKMLLVVLVVRVIIGMVEKNKAVTEQKNESRERVMHPAEFQIR